MYINHASLYILNNTLIFSNQFLYCSSFLKNVQFSLHILCLLVSVIGFLFLYCESFTICPELHLITSVKFTVRHPKFNEGTVHFLFASSNSLHVIIFSISIRKMCLFFVWQYLFHQFFPALFEYMITARVYFPFPVCSSDP